MDWLHRALLLLAIGGLIASLALLPGEVRSARIGGQPALDWYTRPAPETLPTPRSVEAHFSLLVGCSDAFAVPAAELMPSARRDAVTKACLQIADAVLSMSPEFGAAHLVRAHALIRQGSPARAEDALVLSSQAAPHLNWMALRRLDAARRIGAQTGAFPEVVMAADIEHLLASDQGSTAVAAFYNTHEQTRDVIVRLIEDLPARAQTEFLQALQAADQQSGR